MNNSMRSVCALAFLLAACGGSTPEPVTAEAPPEPVVGDVQVQAEPPPVAAPAPVAVKGPNVVACNLATEAWAGQVLKLRPVIGSEPFAAVGRGAKLEVTLPGGNASDGLFVTADAGSVRLQGYVAANELPLYAAGATEVRDFIVPTSRTQLTFLKGSPDSVAFGVTLDASQAKVSDGAPANTKPCSFFSLKPTTFDALSATGSSAQKVVALRPGTHQLSGEMNGPAVGSITVNDKSGYAVQLAKSGSRSRVAWTVGDVVTVGWIDTKQVVPQRETLKTPGAEVAADSTPAKRATGVATWTTATCGSDLNLIAEVGGKRFRVGQLKAGHKVQFGPAVGGQRGVAFPESDVLAGDSAKLFVDAAEVGGACK